MGDPRARCLPYRPFLRPTAVIMAGPSVSTTAAGTKLHLRKAIARGTKPCPICVLIESRWGEADRPLSSLEPVCVGGKRRLAGFAGHRIIPCRELSRLAATSARLFLLLLCGELGHVTPPRGLMFSFLFFSVGRERCWHKAAYLACLFRCIYLVSTLMA
jgi:hypothetical protein